jgi:glycosyltransferase involved in cell wall biosynthesis
VERRVNVALDTTALRLTRAGTARYITALLERLDVEPIAFGDDRRRAVLARELWWYPFRLSRLTGVDVLHCPTYYGPLYPRRPSVVTVHDLAVFRYPEAFGDWTRRYVPRVVPRVLRAASRVIAVSQFTANELEQLLGIAQERIRVVPNGVDTHVFSPDGERAEGTYALAVGTLEPRKNLARTIEATARLGLELRVAGGRGWGGVEPEGEHVRVLGHVGDDELAALYRGAQCVVYASLYEGFGIPVLEALACGTPVVTSQGGACAEVAGGEAVLVDPLDVASIAAGIEEASARGRNTGIDRARSFTWEATAERTHAVYAEVA